MLITIKLLHTLVWVIMASCILAIPVLAVTRRFRWAAAFSVLVTLECLVLAFNGGRCPLTDWAARYTADRASNFDIFLPEWLAHYNKQIFGSLFVAGEGLFFASWMRKRVRPGSSPG